MFDALDRAAAVRLPPLALTGSNDAVLPGTESLSSTSASGLKKVSATDAAGPVAKRGHHVPAARLLAKRRIVTANRSFPPGCGRDGVPLLAVEVQVMLESGRSDRGGLGVPEEMDAQGDCSAADECSVKVADTPCDGATNGAVQDEDLEEGEIPPAKVHPVAQEHPGSQVSINVTLHQPAACGLGAFVQAISAVEAAVSPSSGEKISGSRIQCGENRLPCEDAKDFKVKNSSSWSSCNVADESLSEGPSQEQLRGRRVSEIPKVDKATPDVAVTESGEDATMKSKMMLTPRKKVRPPKMIQKSTGDSKHAPLSENKEENELGRHVSTNQTEDTDEFTKSLVQRALASSENRLMTEGKEAAALTSYFGPRKKVKVQDPAKLPIKLKPKCLLGSKEKLDDKAEGYFGPRKVKVKDPTNIPIKLKPKCELGSKDKLDDKADSNLDDDDLLKGLAVREGKLEFYLKDSSAVRSMKCQRQNGVQNADLNTKVKMMCRRFEIIRRTIAQAVDEHSLKVRRIDLAADKAMKELPDYSKPGPIVGNVLGVEVGDEFLYRVQLAIVGLHRPYQGGIDWTKDYDDSLIAISVVASGGYPDEVSSSGELVYTGAGGKLAGRKASGDQKLERGNIALKNSIKQKNPVRVIHGFKGQNNEEGSHSRAKEITTFTYDGLYHVVDCWTEGQPGSKVFKYRLQRIPGQPELPYGRKTGGIMI